MGVSKILDEALSAFLWDASQSFHDK